MDSIAKKKFRKIYDELCEEAISSLCDDLKEKTRADDIINNKVQLINTPLLKKCHNNLSTFAFWISEFLFKNKNICQGSSGIETFGGGAVSKKSAPSIFKARLSKKDSEVLLEAYDKIKLMIQESKKIRAIYDKECSSRQCQNLLIILLSIEHLFFDLIF